ncbi:hypothetical protein, partial [Klebsiella pneumoniae]|uniref:hypothetical protein n=1 Tax=Klebsiella pneumoniae TaxID=573 RepID=UPI0025A1D2BF
DRRVAKIQFRGGEGGLRREDLCGGDGFGGFSVVSILFADGIDFREFAEAMELQACLPEGGFRAGEIGSGAILGSFQRGG